MTKAGVALLGLAVLASPAGAEQGGALVPAQAGSSKGPAPAAPPAPGRQGQSPPPAPAPAYATSAEGAARTPPLQPDRPVRVNLQRGQQAFFRVAPEAGQAWAVTTRRLGRSTDTVLAALGEGGAVVAEDDDGGQESLASRIEIQPGDGARLVRAGTFDDAPGRFEVILTREQVQPPPDFPTSREAAAERPPLTRDQPVPIRLRRNQQAFFRLPDDRANLIAVTRELAQGTDTVLALLDANGRVLAENDDGGDGLASLLAVSRAAEGPLFVRAGILGNGTGRFELVLQREEPLPPPDYPTSLEAARSRGPVEAGQTIRINLDRDTQAFFALPEGQSLTLSTRNLSERADTVLALLDAQGNVIAEDDDGGVGLASRLTTASASASGQPAFIRASLLDSGRGSFELAVQGAAETVSGGVSPSIAEAARRPTLILGEALRIQLDAGAEAFIALPNDGRPAQAMTFDLGPDVDTELALVDESGTVLEENDDSEGLASRVAIPPTPRPAYLRVKTINGQAGSFSVVLVRAAP